MSDALAGRSTLRDVALLAGVSMSTASKALNNRGDVSRRTREEVLEAARRLSFAPNQMARGLTSGRTRTIGLLTNDLAGRLGFPVMLGIETTMGSEDMSVLLCDARCDAIREQHYLRALVSRQVDGIIVAGETTDPRPSITKDVPVPVVYVYSPSEDQQDTSFVPDDVGGAILATENLLSMGHSRIAHITGIADWRATIDRAAGFRQALGAAGLQPVQVLYGEWSQRWGRRAAEMLLASGAAFDAIVCGSDQIATGVVDTLRSRDCKVPDDVSVIGFDNWTMFAEETQPPLTSVDMRLQQLGATAARELFNAIEGRRQPGVFKQACSLVVRESTAARARSTATASIPRPKSTRKGLTAETPE